MAVNESLGRIGIWSMELRFGDPAQQDLAAAELDELGFGTLWIPGGIDDAVLGDVERLLSVTRRMTIATGILNIWRHQPADVAAWYAGLPAAHKARVMLGVGVSHGPIIGEAWGKPIAVTRDFLEKLAAAGMDMDRVCVAALGPKMVALSGELTAGCHPYLVTPAHSAEARAGVGPAKLVAPEQGVVLDSNPETARAAARVALENYRRLPNYCNSWKRLGFTQDDIDTASDALVDGLFAWGGTEAIAARVKAHHDAGADHVCLQVVPSALEVGYDTARANWRALAAALL